MSETAYEIITYLQQCKQSSTCATCPVLFFVVLICYRFYMKNIINVCSMKNA